MEIPGKKIASFLETLLKKEVRKLKKKIKLVTVLVGESSEQLSFVRIKALTARRLGIQFELIHLKEVPSFEEFMHLLKEKSHDPKNTGLIIQQPLPAQLSTASIYDYLPLAKEIEGHRDKSEFLPPIGLAVLTVLRYALEGNKINRDLLISLQKDGSFFKRALKNKRVILVGRGITGGLPIGKTLNEARINYICINSQTPEPETYYREADVIITAVGKKILDPSVLKPGVILVNAGLRRERGKLKGDYDEKEIKAVSSAYTSTPGGVGPLDVLYLYKNLIEAARMQKK